MKQDLSPMFKSLQAILHSRIHLLCEPASLGTKEMDQETKRWHLESTIKDFTGMEAESLQCTILLLDIEIKTLWVKHDRQEDEWFKLYFENKINLFNLIQEACEQAYESKPESQKS